MQSYLTTEQAADITGKCKETIRRWCRTKKLKSIKTGKEFLIPATEFIISDTEEEKTRKIAEYIFG